MKALSIQQPWAWLIASGRKDIENRSWRTNYRGLFFIHAGKTQDVDAWDDLHREIHPVTGLRCPLIDITGAPAEGMQRGGIVGMAEIVDCVEDSNSEWFVGKFGFLIRNATPVAFLPCKGALGFFTPKFGEPQ